MEDSGPPTRRRAADPTAAACSFAPFAAPTCHRGGTARGRRLDVKEGAAPGGAAPGRPPPTSLPAHVRAPGRRMVRRRVLTAAAHLQSGGAARGVRCGAPRTCVRTHVYVSTTVVEMHRGSPATHVPLRERRKTTSPANSRAFPATRADDCRAINTPPEMSGSSHAQSVLGLDGLAVRSRQSVPGTRVPRLRRLF